MAEPQSLLPDVRGIGRDFSIDGLPKGFVWDMIDYIPNRRGAKLEGRGPWSFLTSGAALAGTIWGGKHAAFAAGPKLLVHGGANLYDHPTSLGGATSIGALFATGLQNGIMLRDRVYFADGAGLLVPKRVTWNGTAFAITALHATAPKAKLVEVYKDRLIATGDPAHPERVSFSPLEVDGGPTAAWDALSFLDTARSVTAFAPMSAQILAFHTKSIEKIRGTIPPGTNLDTDMFTDIFSDQMGCEDPGSVCNWQENVIFANSRGVHLTDGATIRSLTDQGAIGDFWRMIYARKRAGTRVVAGVYLDFLFVSVLTDHIPPDEDEEETITLICNLNERTWFRFDNHYATCFIESESGEEQMWSGFDADNKLVQISPYFSWDVGLPDDPIPPAVNAVDGNARPVLPLLDLGFKRLGDEGVKRVRHVYVSHQTQTVNPATHANPLQVEYEVDVQMERGNMLVAGVLPNSSRYGRHRLRIGRRGYGVHLVIRQVQPTYLSRLYEIGVDEWAQDRGKL